MLSQASQRLALATRRQRQVGVDEAARDSMQLVAPRRVGRRTARLQQGCLEELVKCGFGGLAARREQGGAIGWGGEQRQGSQQLARRRTQAGNRRGEHFLKDFALGAGQALADALNRLTATQLADGPAGEQRVARRRGKRHADEVAAHLRRALALCLRQQELADGLRTKWLG